MNSEIPRPVILLSRYGAAIASKGLRVFLRHVWKQQSSSSTNTDTAFDAALQNPDVLFSYEDQLWSELLKRSLQKVARLFAGEEFAACTAGSNHGHAFAEVLKDFAPLCAQLDAALQTSGFAAGTQESEIELLERLHPHLPQGAWLPPLFSDITIAALWREIAGNPAAVKIAADKAAQFLGKTIKEKGIEAVAPSAEAMQQSITAFAFASVEIAVSHLKWMMEPATAADLESRLIPFLHKVFSHDSLPQNAIPSGPVSSGIISAPANMPSPKWIEQTQRPVSTRTLESKPPQLAPIIPQLDDDEDSVEDVERAAVRDVRWLVSGVGIALVVITLLAIFGRGLFEGGGNEGPVDGPEVSRAASTVPAMSRPETIVDGRVTPLDDPVAISAVPAVKTRLFEQAQVFIDSAARAKVSGDSRQAAEDLSRVLLIYKQEFGNSRWNEQRYKDLRAQYRDQLMLLEFSKEQIDAIEKTLGAHEGEATHAAGTVTEPGLSRMLLLFKRGDDELAGNRSRQAAEAYENGLRLGLEFLGENHSTDRTYQAHLSRYIDFLIGEDLPPDELQDRLVLVKKGKKPGPLPAKKPAPESGGLGLPKL